MNRSEYLKKRQALLDAAQTALDSGDMPGFEAAEKDVKDLDAEYEKTSLAAANLQALQRGAIGANFDNSSINLENAARTETLDLEGAKPTRGDKYASNDYRDAFKNYVQRGERNPLLNLDGPTTTADTGAVIPTTLMHEIISEMKTSGEIYPRLRHLNVQGGVEFPIMDMRPVATWVGEGTGNDQGIEAKDKVSFSYYGLECKLSQSLLSSIVSLSEFEAAFVKLAVEAVIMAIESAVFNGDGNGKMKGILHDDRVPAANVITMTEKEFGSWAAWKKKVFAKMKKSYRSGSFFMAQGTFDGHIDGMVDANGQPIGRVNYGMENGEAYRFGGKEVATVEDDIITGFDNAATGDVVAVFFDPSCYAVNSNMQMTVTKWTDHDGNVIKNKVMVILDGKLLDPHGVLIIKKGAAGA